MKLNSKKSISFSNVFIMWLTFSCKNNSNQKEETIIAGNATVLVDETLQPIIEDQIEVFESQYDAKIKQINKPETEIVNLLIEQKATIAILNRELTKTESTIFENKKVIPRITHFATGAIALITNKISKDTLVDLQEVINLLQSKPSKVNGLVFENSNASTVNYMNALAGVKTGDKKNVYSLINNQEVFEYIAKNPNIIGVVGINHIVQPTPKIKSLLTKINVIAVKNVKSKPNNNAYYKPTQDNIGAGLYPIQQNLYMLNYQGKTGLGMGFASFIAGDIGQRIILKSGLLPVRMPSRNINLRKNIYNNN